MTKSQFRAVVTLTLLLTIVSVVYDFLYADAMTKKLFAYREILEPDWSKTGLYLLAGTISVAVLMMLVGVVGLLSFWNPARHSYLIGCGLLFGITPFIGPYVTSGVNQILYDVSNLLSGVILGLIYFSPIRQYFSKRANDSSIRPAEH